MKRYGKLEILDQLIATASLHIQDSGSTLFLVSGSEGELFSIDDDNDILFAVTDETEIPRYGAIGNGTERAVVGLPPAGTFLYNLPSLMYG